MQYPAPLAIFVVPPADAVERAVYLPWYSGGTVRWRYRLGRKPRKATSRMISHLTMRTSSKEVLDMAASSTTWAVERWAVETRVLRTDSVVPTEDGRSRHTVEGRAAAAQLSRYGYLSQATGLLQT